MFYAILYVKDSYYTENCDILWYKSFRFQFYLDLCDSNIFRQKTKQNKQTNKKHQFVFFSMTINHKKHKQNKTHSKKNLLLDQTQLAIYCLATCAQKIIHQLLLTPYCSLLIFWQSISFSALKKQRCKNKYHIVDSAFFVAHIQLAKKRYTCL